MVQTPNSNYSDEVLIIISTKAMGNFFLHEPMITLQKCRVLAKAIMFPGTLLWLSTKASQWRSPENNFAQSVLQKCRDYWEDNHVPRNSAVALSQSLWRRPRNNTERGMEDNGSTVSSSSRTHLVDDYFRNISIFITFLYNLRLQVIIHFARAHHILQHNMQQVQQ